MPNRKSFAYVVLQYGGFDITRKCLESIHLVNESSPIVVVDNCSPDDSLSQLQSYASDHTAVHVIANVTNSGFSHGNNIGYQYARNNLDANYVVVLNNDIEIPQNNFEEHVNAIYEASHFAVFGPDIYVPTRNIHQNPFHVDGDIWHPDNPNLWDINKLLDYTKEQLADLDNPGAIHALAARVKQSKFFSSLRTYKHSIDNKRNSDKWTTNWTGHFENVPLQGAFYVFGPEFLKAMTACFYPEPFLYCEEILLQMNCLHKGLKMVYDSSVQVHHMENATTKRLFNDDELRKKQRFELENKYKSECLCGLYRVKLDEEEGKPEQEIGEREKMTARANAVSVFL